jgi:hypothetical protein
MWCRVIALLILDLGARRGWVVSTTPWPLYPRERPSTHCTGVWVGARAGLDLRKKFRPNGDFLNIFSYRVLCCSGIGRRTACCGFFHQEKSDGFGRERTRDLGYQRPACKPLDHRSRYRDSIPGPSSPQPVAVPTELPGPQSDP